MVHWTGTVDKCQLCNGPYGNTMYDARIPSYGQWGNICKTCFNELGCSLGTGRGQSYELQSDGKWLKTGG